MNRYPALIATLTDLAARLDRKRRATWENLTVGQRFYNSERGGYVVTAITEHRATVTFDDGTVAHVSVD